MRKGFISALFLMLSGQVFSQQIFTDYLQFYPSRSSDSAKGNYVLVQGEASVNSTSATNAFLSRFLYSGFITEEVKDQVSERFKEVNRFGFLFNSSVTVSVERNETSSWITGVAARQINAAAYSPDLFNLFFRGNKMYAGRTANIAPLSYLSVDYQSLFFGINKRLTEKKLNMWAGMSAIRGGGFQNAEVNRGLLYTEPDGAYIEADAEFFITGNTGVPQLISPAGGAGASVFLGADYRTGKSALAFSVTDLGFIRWNNLKTFTGNSEYRFEGKEINNFLYLDESLFSTYTGDSLAKDLGINSYTENKFYFLPTFLQLTHVYYYSEKFFWITGMEQIVNARFFPRFFIKPVFQVSNLIFLNAKIAAGGYGRADLELGAAGNLGKGVSFGVSLFAAELLLAPGKTSGHGLAVSAVKRF